MAPTVDDHSCITNQLSMVPSIASVSVGEVVGRALPLQKPPRILKFLIEWREQTIPIVLDENETLGTVYTLNT